MSVTLDAELAFLLEEKEVSPVVASKLREYGMKSISRFILMAASYDEWRRIFREEWEMDPAASKENRLALVCLLDAWDDAKTRMQKEREADAEARQQGLPRHLGKKPHQLARKALEVKFHAFTDKQVPAPAVVDVVLAQLEDNFVECIPFTDVLSVDDVEGDDPEFDVTWTKTGSMKMRKATRQVPLPRDPEELRARVLLWTMAHAFAAVRMPTRAWLESATPTAATTYCDYLLGNRVRTLGSSSEGGGVNPSWTQVLRYDKEVRRKQATLINEEGRTFEEALSAACRDSETRELFLVGPTVQAAAAARAPTPPFAAYPQRERTPRGKGNQQQAGKGGRKLVEGAEQRQVLAQRPEGQGSRQRQAQLGSWERDGLCTEPVVRDARRQADLLQLELGDRL